MSSHLFGAIRWSCQQPIRKATQGGLVGYIWRQLMDFLDIGSRSWLLSALAGGREDKWTAAAVLCQCRQQQIWDEVPAFSRTALMCPIACDGR
uniref:Uncharacterized protein n=1 Tax=Bionectria ochroleuca TaxID=29856 RepID=A0A0B7JLA6_BIOOC